MEPVELAIPVAVAVPNLMGSDIAAEARAGVADAQGCDNGRGLLFSGPTVDECSALISQRDSECNANGLESSSWIKKVEAGSCRNTILLSTMDSMVLAAGAEGKRSQKKGRRGPKSSPGLFKISQTFQLVTSISPSEDVDMKGAADEHSLHMKRSICAEKSQRLKQKSSLNCRRGDRRNVKVPLNAKHDCCRGTKMFGAYGLKADLPDISKLADDISLNVLLDGSYKYPIVAKEKAKRPANTCEKNILHIVRKVFSIVQPQQLSQSNKQYDGMDVSFTKELSSLPNSNLSMSRNLDVDEETSVASDWSCTKKVQISCSNTEDPPNTRDLLHHLRDLIENLDISPPKDLNSLLQDPTISRCHEPHPGKPLSHRAALSSFPWSHNHYCLSKTHSDLVKVSCKSICQGRWIRIGKSATFLGGDSESVADLDSLGYDNSLVPSGSVRYILPKIQITSSKISGTRSTEQSSLLVCPTSSPSPPDLFSPKERTAAQALYDIANRRPSEAAYGTVKWPKQPSQKAMKACKSKSIQGPENLLTPKSEVMLDNTDKFMDNATPLKKLKFSSSEKRDHSAAINTPRPPQFWSAPRSSRDPALDANKHQINGNVPKPLFRAPPRRVSEKSNHSQQHKVRKVLQMDWNRGKGQL